MEIFSYLLKTTLCMAFFYLPNRLLFKKLSFYNLYRAYILIAIACSLVIPMLQLPSAPAASSPAAQFSAVIGNQKETLDHFLIKPITSPVFNAANYILMIYCSVAVWMLIKLGHNIFRIIQTTRRHGKKLNGNWLVYNRYPKSASFFNVIFLNNTGLSREDEEKIIAHERLHIGFKHSADILFLELLKCIFWFNPLIYLFRKDLREVHEYQVDQVLVTKFNPKDYAKLLVRLSAPDKTQLVHQFSSNELEERISRMFNRQTSRLKKLSYLFAIPVIFIPGYFLSAQQSYAFPKSKNKLPFTLVIDAGHGGAEPGALYHGRTEKYYTLLMAKKIAAIAVQGGIRVLLTRNDDGDLKLASRIKRKGDLFISLHVKGADETLERTRSGLDIIISEENKEYEKSENFARILQHNFKQLGEIKTAEVAGSTRNYILRNCPSAAVLIELGCISNEDDIKYISSLKGQEEIAGKIIDAIRTYHD